MPRRLFSWLTWLSRVCPGACALLAIATGANARERFEVPDGCGSESAFESEFERLTGTPAPDDVPASLVIEALGAKGYELRLLVRNEQRVLRDPDCRTLWRSAIVISAAAIGLEPPLAEPASPALTVPESPPSDAEPSSAVSPAAPGAPPAASSPAAPARATPSAPASASPPPARPAPSTRARPTRRPSLGRTRANRRPRAPAPTSATSQRSRPASSSPAASSEPGGVRYGVELGAGVSGGVIPGVGAALELGARLEAWPGAVLLGLRYWPERSVSREGRGVDVSAVGVRGAAAVWAARRLQVLGGVELNRLAGVGLEGVSGRSSDAAWQLAPTLGVSLIVWDNQYLRIELGGVGRASLIRPAFVVTGYGEVYQVPVFGADAIIRGVWLFP